MAKTFNGMNPAYVATMVEAPVKATSVKAEPAAKAKKPSQAGNPRCMQCGKERYARVDSHFCTHKCALVWADVHMIQVNPEHTVKQVSFALETNAVVKAYGWCQRCMLWSADHVHSTRVWPK